LTCAHHDNLRLYGTRAADLAACVSHVALAATIGTLRIVSDMHYASDVITGAVIGSIVGLTIPYVFHYKPPIEKSNVSLTVVPMPTGIAVTGIFG
jgi:membrane-associated phospholipid phosphatase